MWILSSLHSVCVCRRKSRLSIFARFCLRSVFLLGCCIVVVSYLSHPLRSWLFLLSSLFLFSFFVLDSLLCTVQHTFSMHCFFSFLFFGLMAACRQSDSFSLCHCDRKTMHVCVFATLVCRYFLCGNHQIYHNNSHFCHKCHITL